MQHFHSRWVYHARFKKHFPKVIFKDARIADYMKARDDLFFYYMNATCLIAGTAVAMHFLLM